MDVKHSKKNYKYNEIFRKLFNQMIAKFLFFLLLVGMGMSKSYAQTFNGKHLIWQLSNVNEPRLNLRFGTTGINIGGYEGTSLVLENTTKSVLLVEVKLTIKDFCNQLLTRTVKVTIKANGKVGGSTWMGGSEQHDYQSTCAERKTYATNFSTKIFAVTLDIVSVRDLTKEKEEQSGGGPANPDDGEDDDGSSSSAGAGSGTSGNKNKLCATFGFKFSNTPSYNCVALEWWSLSTKINTIDANGNFKQSSGVSEAKYFTIQFRKQGNINWTSDKRDNTGRNVHILTGLDACTKYEVRLIATCENNTTSNPSNIVRFTTACNKPGDLIIESINDNSAKISSKRQIVSTYPCGGPENQIRIIEFKTNTTAWDEVMCNSGSPCYLSALSPGVTYRVRARYKYGNNLYSNYTNEVSFTTSGKQQSNSSHYSTNNSKASTGSSESTGSTTGTLKVPGIIGSSTITDYYWELSWNGVSGATSYEILLATKSNFSDAVSFTTSNTQYAPTNYANADVYYWQVRAKGANGKYSNWSPIAKIKR